MSRTHRALAARMAGGSVRYALVLALGGVSPCSLLACRDSMVLGESKCVEQGPACGTEAPHQGVVDGDPHRYGFEFQSDTGQPPILRPTWTIDLRCESNPCDGVQLESAPDGDFWLAGVDYGGLEVVRVSTQGTVVSRHGVKTKTTDASDVRLTVDEHLNAFFGPYLNEDFGLSFLGVNGQGVDTDIELSGLPTSGHGFFTATPEGHVRALRSNQSSSAVYDFDGAGKLAWKQSDLREKPATAYSSQELTALGQGVAISGGNTAVVVSKRGALGDHWGVTALDSRGDVVWDAVLQHAGPGSVLTSRVGGGFVIASPVEGKKGAVQFCALNADGIPDWVAEMTATFDGVVAEELHVLALETDREGEVYVALARDYEQFRGSWVLCRMRVDGEPLALCADAVLFPRDIGAGAPLSANDMVVLEPGVVVASYMSSYPDVHLSLSRIEVPALSDFDAWAGPPSSDAGPPGSDAAIDPTLE
ncbi:MAG: hypothetical protein QM778_28105 [Myxococcales bacterium]